jgi:hypothetical protein
MNSMSPWATSSSAWLEVTDRWVSIKWGRVAVTLGEIHNSHAGVLTRYPTKQQTIGVLLVGRWEQRRRSLRQAHLGPGSSGGRHLNQRFLL